MNEFEPLATDIKPAPAHVAPPQKKESLMTRKLFLGQSLPWLLGGALVLIFAGWFLFWPASTPPDANQLAFGQDPGFSAVASSTTQEPIMTGGLSEVATTQNVADIDAGMPADVVKLIREGREFEAANREAITRLSETVRAQSTALTSLQQSLDKLAADNSQLSSKLAVLETRQVPVATSQISSNKTSKRSTLSGMRIEGLHDGMAWVSWQGRTWAVQPGDRLGGVTVRDINVEERSVTTSGGVLR